MVEIVLMAHRYRPSLDRAEVYKTGVRALWLAEIALVRAVAVLYGVEVEYTGIVEIAQVGELVVGDTCTAHGEAGGHVLLRGQTGLASTSRSSPDCAGPHLQKSCPH